MTTQKNVIKPKPKKQKEKKEGYKLPEPVKEALETPKDIFSGDIIEGKEPVKIINLLIWLTVLGFLYITNNYWAEEKIREINREEKVLKELRYKYISTKSKLMTMSRQSEVVKRLRSRGYKENKEPLKVIKVTKEDLRLMRDDRQ